MRRYRPLAFDLDLRANGFQPIQDQWADTFAREWAQERGVPYRTEKPNLIQLGRRAGPDRNAMMLSLDPDKVVAFPGGRGTADMVRQAEERGYLVMRG